MARKKYAITEARIRRYLKEGRGQGQGAGYKPWLRTSDVPSLGRAHRVYCPKTGREHHLLSDNEYFAFFHYWWDDAVVDIREQFPLINRKDTKRIADSLGVRHPFETRTGTFVVMTTDFLLTVRNGNRYLTCARAVKEASDLDDDRVLEKLEIERIYLEERGVEWKLVTDREVKTPFARNLEWIFPCFDEDCLGEPGLFAVYSTRFLEAFMRAPHAPAWRLCQEFDSAFGLFPGAGLTLLRHLLARKVLTADLSVGLLQDRPASSFAVNPNFGGNALCAAS